VGIPAWSQHLADDKYTRDGYGGLEVVQCVDGLTAVDLQDLATLVDQGGDIDALTLRPRADRPLDLAELESMLNSTLIRREFASILSHYNPEVDPGYATAVAVQNMLDAQSETTRVRAGYATLHEFYWGEARPLQEQLDAAHHRRQSNLRGVLAEHELETRALREEVGELRSQVESASLGSHSFPSGWAPSVDQARSPLTQLMFQESDVREIMKNEPVVWEMLTSMKFWNRLDESFWAKYVPQKYYLCAELRLDRLHSEGVRPGYWPDLVDADVRVAQAVMDDGSSEHDCYLQPG
ncbi:hypothetical protein PHMEG_00035434, partial [Phytophthora megakarya]